MTTLFLLTALLCFGCREEPKADAHDSDHEAHDSDAETSGDDTAGGDSAAAASGDDGGSDDGSGDDGGGDDGQAHTGDTGAPTGDGGPPEDTAPPGLDGEGTCESPYLLNLSELSWNFNHTASGAYANAKEHAPSCGGATARDIIYRVSTAGAGELRVLAQSSGSTDPVLSRTAGEDCGGKELACVNDAGAAIAEVIAWETTPGEVSLLVVREVKDSGGDVQLSFTFTAK